MVKRGLGAEGYYPEKQSPQKPSTPSKWQGGRERQREQKLQKSQKDLKPLLAIFLFLILLLFFLFSPQGKEVITAIKDAATGKNFFPTPQEIPSLKATPTGGVKTSPTLPFSSATPPAQSSPTPFGEKNLSKKFLLSATTGPFNYSIGGTVLEVFKTLLVTESLYKENLSVTNIGEQSVEFNLVDIIPRAFGITIWDANFAQPYDKMLSDTAAAFTYSIDPGETITHGPTQLAIGNTTNTVSNIFVGTGEGDENATQKIAEALGDYSLDAEQSLAASQFVSDSQSDADSGEWDGVDEWEFFEDDLELFFDDYLTDLEIARLVGSTCNYEAVSNITKHISEAKPFTFFTLPLTNCASEPLFAIEGEVKDFATTNYSINQTALKVELNFSHILLEQCKLPFDEVNGTVKLTFQNSSVKKIYEIPLQIIVDHEGVYWYSGEGLVWPTPCCNHVISKFGVCRDGCARSHQGIDIGWPIGTPIFALQDALVTKAINSDSGRCGKQVNLQLLDGSNWKIINCHMDTIDVVAGQTVKKCQKLGTVGKTGNAATTPPHDHFEIRPDGVHPVDPLSILNTAGYCQEAVSGEEPQGEPVVVTPASSQQGPLSPACTFGGGSGEGSVGSAGCYLDLIKESADKRNLDACLLLAIMKTESSCNKDAVGGDGECGLMQVMPQWFQNHQGWTGGNGILPFNYYSSPNYADPVSCFIPANNIEAGATVFARNWMEGEITESLCAYNTGSRKSSCPYADRVMAKYDENCLQALN